MRVLYISCLALFLCSSVFSQREKSILLPESEAKSATNQCSRLTPKFSGTWTPSSDQLKGMESKLKDIAKLRPKIDKPEDYYMQYVGLVINGRKFIYINAFPGYIATSTDSLQERGLMEPWNWKKSALVVCDGGRSYWGVLFDAESETFSDLAVNGDA